MSTRARANRKNAVHKPEASFDRDSLIKLLTGEGGNEFGLILNKRPQDLTKNEVRQVSEKRLSLPAGTEKEALFRFEQAFYDDKFGREAAKVDETGRLVDPQEKRTINPSPVPPKAPDGTDLVRAVDRLARRVADVAASEGTTNAVRFLQRGLNVLNHAVTREESRTSDLNTELHKRRSERAFDGQPMFPDLKDDGAPGQKTRNAIQTVVARLGPAKGEEALALGQFDTIIRNISDGRLSRDLGYESRAVFGPLFRDSKNSQDQARTEEGESLQMAINDLGLEILGRSGFTGIREDGFVGPRTNEAFKKALNAAGPERMTNALGQNLGFFMFDTH